MIRIHKLQGYRLKQKKKVVSDMLMLFTSATRAGYFESVLDTMNLPQGASICYQYPRVSDDKDAYPYIHESAQKATCIAGEETLVFLINRDAPNAFKYIPLRKGKLLFCEESEGMLYYTVELGAYCSADNAENYADFLETEIDGKLYYKSQGGKRSGFYVFRCLPQTEVPVSEKPNSWRETVLEVSQCGYFQKAFPIFTKFGLYSAVKEQPVRIRCRGNERFFLLHYGKKYRAKIDYFIPDVKFDHDKAAQTGEVSAEMKIEIVPDCLESTFPLLRLGAEAGMVKSNFAVKGISKNAELRYGSVTRNGSKESLYFAPHPIALKTKRSKWRWGLIIGILVLMLLCNVVDKFPVDKIIEAVSQTNEGAAQIEYGQFQLAVAQFLNKYQGVYPAFAGMLNSGLTFVLVLIYGESAK